MLPIYIPVFGPFNSMQGGSGCSVPSRLQMGNTERINIEMPFDVTESLSHKDLN